MKKSILYILFFCFSLSLSAQSIAFDEEVYYKVFDINENNFETVVYAEITNTTAETVNFIWQIREIEAQEEWVPYFCDLNLCYAPGVLTISKDKFNEFKGEEVAEISFHVAHDQTPGHGVYEIDLIDIDTDEVINTMMVNLAETTVSSKNITKDYEISLFPNPVSESFSIQGDIEEVSALEVFNVLGKKVKTIPFSSSNQYDVSNVSNGRYIVRAIDNQGQTMKVLRLIKY